MTTEQQEAAEAGSELLDEARTPEEDLRAVRLLLEQNQLTKREQLTAYALMGLTSRLQPVNVTNEESKRKVVQLAIQMADLALAELVK